MENLKEIFVLQVQPVCFHYSNRPWPSDTGETPRAAENTGQDGLWKCGGQTGTVNLWENDVLCHNSPNIRILHSVKRNKLQRAQLLKCFVDGRQAMAWINGGICGLVHDKKDDQSVSQKGILANAGFDWTTTVFARRKKVKSREKYLYNMPVSMLKRIKITLNFYLLGQNIEKIQKIYE